MKDDRFERRDASLVEIPETAARCCCTNATIETSVHGWNGMLPPVSCVIATQIVQHPVSICTGGEYQSRRQGRYARRVARRLQNKLDRARQVGGLSQVFTFHKMYSYGKKCCNNVRWKQSVQRFELHLFSGTAKRRKDVLYGRYRWKKFIHFILRERGKVREIDAPHVHDRQVHKVLTKEVLLPLYEPLMIWNNGASMPNKGMLFAQNELKNDLRRHFNKYGLSGYIIVTDCSGFFPNASYSIIDRHHKKIQCDASLCLVLDDVIKSFGWKKGVPLGVEPSQMEMVVYPSIIDNFMKCQLGLDGAGHYMDDYYMLIPPGVNPKELFFKFKSKADENSILLNERKTRIIKFGSPFRFCKVKYAVTQTGRIVVHGGRDAAKRCRKKLRTLCTKIRNGEISFVDLWSSFQSTMAYYSKTNDHGRVLSLRRRFYSLFGFSGEDYRNFKRYIVW